MSHKIAVIGPLFRRENFLPSPAYILVDGGAHFQEEIQALLPSSPSPFFLKVGDGDSYDGPLDMKWPREKDYSDFKGALDLLPDRVEVVHLLGFLGGRLDHQLFCLGEVHRYLEKKGKTLFTFDKEILAWGEGRWEVDVQGIFSLAVLQSTAIRLTGRCQFPLEHETKIFPLSSRGLSNRGRGRICIESDGPFFLLKGRGEG